MTHVRGLHCRLVAAAFILLAAGTSRAAMISRCTAPGMFPDSDMTVFVFPFVDYTSRDSSLFESPVGTELAGLIQADTLLAISRYGCVAAIRMLGSPEECREGIGQPHGPIRRWPPRACGDHGLGSHLSSGGRKLCAELCLV